MDHEEGNPLAAEIQAEISTMEVDHKFVDDIDSVEPYVSDNTAYIFTELVEKKICYDDEESFSFSTFEIPFEHALKIIDASGQVKCADLQSRVFHENMED